MAGSMNRRRRKREITFIIRGAPSTEYRGGGVLIVASRYCNSFSVGGPNIARIRIWYSPTLCVGVRLDRSCLRQLSIFDSQPRRMRP